MALLVALLLTVAAADAEAATDPRELKAREAFAAGRYQEALDQFAKLYAESLHPNYLRNIGRCYQNLGDPDRAVTSFRDYLRKAKGLPRDEKKEIEGYITEMEALKKQREAAPSPAPAPAPVVATPAPPPSPPPAPLPAAPDPGVSTKPTLVSTPASQPAESSSPVYKRWWFWAIVGGAVATGLGVAAAAGVFTKTEEPSCGADTCS